MKIALGIVAVAGLATVASAQLSTASPNRSSPGPYGDRATTYSWDDGTAENGVGLTGGGVLAAINAFPVAAGDNVITSVDVSWGTPAFPGASGVVTGATFDYYVWSANGPGSNPSGAGSTLLFSGTSTINGANVDNDTFQSLAVPSVAISSTFFYVGVAISHAGGTFPIGTDLTNPTTSGVSWAAGGASFDPNNVSFSGGGTIDIAPSGFGNWMLRANAVPAPSALALIGLGGIVAGRRRR